MSRIVIAIGGNAILIMQSEEQQEKIEGTCREYQHKLFDTIVIPKPPLFIHDIFCKEPGVQTHRIEQDGKNEGSHQPGSSLAQIPPG